MIQQPGSIAAKHLAFSKGKLVQVAEHETVAHIKIGIAVFQVGIGLVAEVSLILGAQAGAGSIIKRMTISVRGLELQAMSDALFPADLQRMVIRFYVRAKGRDRSIEDRIAIVRVRQITRN